MNYYSIELIALLGKLFDFFLLNRLRDLLKLKLHRSRTPVSDYQYPNMPSDFHLYDVINNQAGRSTENGRF